MDANRISSIEVMKQGIAKGMYEITGILKTGEIVIALVSNIEKEYLGKTLNSNKTEKKKLLNVQALISITNRPAKELLQVYKQNICDENKRSSKNGLRFR